MPVGDERQRQQRQFRCNNCGGRGWRDSSPTSQCRECEGDGELLPAGQEVELRQFKCMCDGTEDGHIWYERAERSVCRECRKWVDAVPVGEEEGVFVCKFECDCEEENCGCANDPDPYEYCMCDTAKCYRCRGNDHDGHHVAPYGFLSRRYVKKTTNNVHSCIRCNGSGDCPNFREI